MSGYDIKRHISESLAYFWSEGYGRIYPVLGELAKEGLVTRSVEQQESRPDRHVYTITEEGLACFRRWLAEPPEPVKHRVEALLKVVFGAFGPIPDTLAHVRTFRAQQQARLEYYGSVAEQIKAQAAEDPCLPYWLISIRCGVHVSSAFIAWCDEAEASLEELAKASQA